MINKTFNTGMVERAVTSSDKTLLSIVPASVSVFGVGPLQSPEVLRVLRLALILSSESNQLRLPGEV